VLAAQPAFAQGKVVRLVTGFPPGGPVDFVARVMSEQLGKELGHSVIAENRAGANAASPPSSSRNRPRTVTPCS